MLNDTDAAVCIDVDASNRAPRRRAVVCGEAVPVVCMPCTRTVQRVSAVAAHSPVRPRVRCWASTVAVFADETVGWLRTHRNEPMAAVNDAGIASLVDTRASRDLV